jgi:hypothetical protein
VTLSHVTYEDSFQSGQVLKKKLSDKGASSLSIFNIEIYLQILPIIAFFFTFFLSYIMINISSSIKKVKLILNNLLRSSITLTQSMDAVSFIVLFYSIYLMIFMSIISNNVKTNSVIVDTREIVDSNEDLLNTKRKICFMY